MLRAAVALVAIAASGCLDISAEIENQSKSEVVEIWTDGLVKREFESGQISLPPGKSLQFDPSCNGEWCVFHIRLANGSEFEDAAYVEPILFETSGLIRIKVKDDHLETEVLW